MNTIDKEDYDYIIAEYENNIEEIQYEVDELLEKNESLKNQHNDCYKKLDLLQKDNTKPINISNVKSNFEDSLKSHLDTIKNIDDLIKIHNKIKSLDNLSNSDTIYNCKNCKKNFTKSVNFKNSCQFHNGILKYNFCKTCGNNEYFSCCNNCINCNQGCSIGYHIP